LSNIAQHHRRAHPDVVHLAPRFNPAYAIFDHYVAHSRGGHAMLAGVFRSAAWWCRLGISPLIADALDRCGDIQDGVASPEPRHTPFNIHFTRVAGRRIAVGEDIVHDTPFGDLVHFDRVGTRDLPKMLIVAPMSGHDAKIMTQVVGRLLPTHDVFITDWRNARDVPKSAGRFGLDTYVETLIDWTSMVGAGTHLLGVSQSTLPIAVATAVMAGRKMDTQPASITLMAGPLKPGANHSAVSRTALKHDLATFERHLIHTVPSRYAGAGRQVYPGKLQNQLLAMTAASRNPVRDGFNAATTGRTFGKMTARTAVPPEMLRPSDIPAEFLLETLERGFRREDLANGTWVHHTLDAHNQVRQSERVDLGAIRNTSVFTVEGGRDTITPAGQTTIIHNLTHNLSNDRKFHAHHQDADHYDTIAGPIWNNKIAPQVIEITCNSYESIKSRRRRQALNQPKGQVECWTP
jgi:poly(3-hydroxybutyrate) depolymerase